MEFNFSCFSTIVCGKTRSGNFQYVWKKNKIKLNSHPFYWLQGRSLNTGNPKLCEKISYTNTGALYYHLVIRPILIHCNDYSTMALRIHQFRHTSVIMFTLHWFAPMTYCMCHLCICAESTMDFPLILSVHVHVWASQDLFCKGSGTPCVYIISLAVLPCFFINTVAKSATDSSCGRGQEDMSTDLE